ncbi:MAG: ABC transporter permease [Burkholderiales bacterium]|nr:ABC transporter permease [Burkholderiales bacterium]
MSDQVTVYTPDSALASPRKMVVDMFRDLLRGREMAWRLAVRDIQAQYRQALLGIVWAFIGPLATTITWVFLSSSGVVAVGKTDVPYPVYVLTGTLLWSILSDSINGVLTQTSSARALLAKLNFPREALLLAGIYKQLFHTGIKVVLLLLALLWVGVTPGWSLLLFPLGVASLLLVGTAIGLMVTPVGMLYTDVQRIVPFLMNFMMYLTPVVFPMPKEGWVATLYQVNPFTPLVDTARSWFTSMPAEMLGYFLIVNAVAACMLLVFWAAWRLAMPIIIERMSA